GVDYTDQSTDPTGMIARERDRVQKHGGALVITDTAKSSSTKLIQNGGLLDLPRPVLDWLERGRRENSPDEMPSYIEGAFSKLEITVLGDLIIDEYVTCTPVGTTSKSPTISAVYRSTEKMAGGSAAIARHVAQYAGQVRLICQRGEQNWAFDNLVGESL